jgi:hypothetical protein
VARVSTGKVDQSDIPDLTFTLSEVSEQVAEQRAGHPSPVACHLMKFSCGQLRC